MKRLIITVQLDIDESALAPIYYRDNPEDVDGACRDFALVLMGSALRGVRNWPELIDARPLRIDKGADHDS
jgi:hypothetical protein